MATLQSRNGSHRLLFQYEGKQQAFTIGAVSLTEARQWKSRVEALLLRIRQRLLEVPEACSINDFILHDGKPPAVTNLTKVRKSTLGELRDAYVKVFSNGAIEANTLATAKIHLAHIETTLGTSFLLPALTLAKLQEHVDRRSKGKAAVAPVTIKKEIDTFRAVWNWGQRNGLVSGVFPCAGLVYAKGDEVLPFMPREEIERRIKAGGDAGTLWECLYLNAAEVSEFLEFAKKANVRDYLYPMLVMAAHTGARRSELMRCRLEDVDLANAMLTIREKKRARGTRTTRRVPISKLLGEVLAEQMKKQEGKAYLFGDGIIELTDGQAHKAFMRLVEDSKWEVLKGFHILRHAFISALCAKGVDQRIIDEFAGHSTEQQRRRYRHLMPQVTRDAITGVFG
jgi:integrase